MKLSTLFLTLFLAACAKDGSTGATGQTGPIGQPGTNGQSCTVTQLEDTTIITCPDGTHALITNNKSCKNKDKNPKDK